MICDFYGLKFHLSYVHATYTTKNIFEIPPCAKPFSDPQIYFIKGRILDQNDKFTNKNDHLCVWRDLKNKSLQCM